MGQRNVGWMIGVAAFGMMCTLLAGDVKNLQQWNDALDPAFVAGFMTHLGVVAGAFVGGNLVPNMFKDRSTDTAPASAPVIAGK